MDKDILTFLVTTAAFILVFVFTKKTKWKWWLKSIIAFGISVIIFAVVISPISISNNSLPEKSSFAGTNVSHRDCVPTSAYPDVMSCDGTGITNEQGCKNVCSEENGLTNIRYVTNMSVNSRNLGLVAMNACYCFEGENLKYMYIIPS